MLAIAGLNVVWYLVREIRKRWADYDEEIIWDIDSEDLTADKFGTTRLFGRTFDWTSTRRPRRDSGFDDFRHHMW